MSEQYEIEKIGKHEQTACANIPLSAYLIEPLIDNPLSLHHKEIHDCDFVDALLPESIDNNSSQACSANESN